MDVLTIPLRLDRTTLVALRHIAATEGGAGLAQVRRGRQGLGSGARPMARLQARFPGHGHRYLAPRARPGL